MAAQLGVLSLSQLQNLVESQQQHHQLYQPPPDSSSITGYWMWNTKNTAADDEDSWEIRAFEEDTGNNATWPPRSYTCTFCRREFRSAQALGGHMNVHRRDRARLHQAQPNIPRFPSTNNPGSSTLLFPAQELVTNAGLCLLYSLPNPNGPTVFSPATVKSCNMNSSPTLLSISPFATTNNLPSPNFPATTQFISTSSLKPPAEPSQASNSNSDNNINNNNYNNYSNGSNKREAAIEDELQVDLELRLGCGSCSSSSP